MAPATSGSVAFSASQSAAYSLITAPLARSCRSAPTLRTCRPPSNGVANQTRTISRAYVGAITRAPMPSTLASLWRRDSSARNRSWHRAARMPCTLLATICSPCPDPTHHDPAVRLARRDRAGGRRAERRVVHGLGGVRSEVHDVVSLLLQEPLQVLLQGEPRVVAAERDAHLGLRRPGQRPEEPVDAVAPPIRPAPKPPRGSSRGACQADPRRPRRAGCPRTLRRGRRRPRARAPPARRVPPLMAGAAATPASRPSSFRVKVLCAVSGLKRPIASRCSRAIVDRRASRPAPSCR